MFGENIFRSVFNDPFFQPSMSMSTAPNRGASLGRIPPAGDERCSAPKPRDIFTEFSRAADEFFDAATRSFFRSTPQLMRFSSEYLRELSRLPETQDQSMPFNQHGIANTANQFETGTSRPFRHISNEPVQMNRSRLQWYDSNTRRPLLPIPPTNPPEPSGRLTVTELARLPLSTYRIKPIKSSDKNQRDKPEESAPVNPPDYSPPIPVVNSNAAKSECSPGSAYLQPVSKVPTLVEIQPLQSSPTRGHPECEVCLTEYRDKDQLRHLPCGHAFHMKCIDTWLTQSSTCPKCRAGVRTGLKRLERNRQRMRIPVVAETAPPVRAIRQTPARTVPAPKRTTTGQTNRSQSRRRTQISTSSSSNASPATDRSPVESNSDDRSSSFVIHDSQSSVNGIRLAELSLNTTNQSTRLGSGPTSGHCRPASRTSAQNESIVARKKAAEAAIRRAEQAARERAERLNAEPASRS